MIEEEKLIEAGEIYKPHALKGELNAYSDYDKDLFNQGYPVIIPMDGIYIPFYLMSVRNKGKHTYLFMFDGIDTLEKAYKLSNTHFFMLKKDVAEFLQIDEDELEWDEDFTDYLLIDEKYGNIGRITGIDTTTDNFLLIVQPEGDEKKEPLLVPFVEEFIRSETQYEEEKIKETGYKGEVLMELPEGVLNINDAADDEEESDD